MKVGSVLSVTEQQRWLSRALAFMGLTKGGHSYFVFNFIPLQGLVFQFFYQGHN